MESEKFIDDEFVLFKDYTMLQVKTMFYSLPTGASGGGIYHLAINRIKRLWSCIGITHRLNLVIAL